jgi:hypothetical protein
VESGGEEKLERYIMAGASTQLYANLGGLLAGLVAFILVAISYFVFTQKTMMSTSYVVPFVLVNLALAVYLVIQVSYTMEFQEKITL